MTSKIKLQKQKIRKEILEKLRSQAEDQIFKKSKIIEERLFKLEEFKKADCVIAYMSMKEEAATRRIIDESIRMGKIVGVPVVVKGRIDLIISQISGIKDDFEVGPYGIPQPRGRQIRPIPYKEMRLILVPGLAFDRHGNRLGRGKGYYDRFLKKVPEHALTIGLCFDFQLTEAVPTLPHDIPVRKVVSNI